VGVSSRTVEHYAQEELGIRTIQVQFQAACIQDTSQARTELWKPYSISDIGAEDIAQFIKRSPHYTTATRAHNFLLASASQATAQQCVTSSIPYTYATIGYHSPRRTMVRYYESVTKRRSYDLATHVQRRKESTKSSIAARAPAKAVCGRRF
jgi:hypothetical protein